jgi:hypothetical protein
MRQSTFAFVILIFSPGLGSAASITQTISGHFADHETNFSFYRQFDPAMGRLTGVTLEFVNSNASSNIFAFQNFNQSPVTVTNTIDYFITYGDNRLDLNGVFVDTIAANARVDHVVTSQFSGSTVYTTDLSRFIGNFFLGPDISFGDFTGGTATTTGTGIDITRFSARSLTFTENITYTYHTPEPPSLVTMGLGLLSVIVIRGLRWYWRPVLA